MSYSAIGIEKNLLRAVSKATKLEDEESNVDNLTVARTKENCAQEVNCFVMTEPNHMKEKEGCRETI